MQYQGGKFRYRKYIVPLVEALLEPGMVYYEPFLGGANILPFVNWPDKVGMDANPFLIALYKHIADGGTWPQEEITFEMYDLARIESKKAWVLRELDDWHIGFILLIASYNGKFGGGYRPPHKHERFWHRPAIEQLINTPFSDAIYLSGSYDSHDYGIRGVIYCDPPYVNTLGYRGVGDFNHAYFYDWCVEMGKTHTVIISESTMPEDRFNCIMDMPARAKDRMSKARPERIFTPK